MTTRHETRCTNETHSEVPVDVGEEFAFEQVEFLDACSADLCVVTVGAKDVAESL